MPGPVEVGLTTDGVESPLTQLSAPPGVPFPPDVYLVAEVEEGTRIKKPLHQPFAEHRVNLKPEIPRFDPQEVVLGTNSISRETRA